MESTFTFSEVIQNEVNLAVSSLIGEPLIFSYAYDTYLRYLSSFT